jgi:hypothetical protein
LVAVAASLSLVVSVQPPANAYANATPTIIRSALAAAPAVAANGGRAVLMGGLCATGLGCVALGVSALAITAYATHDTWMPWVKSMFEGDMGRAAAGSASGCTVTLSGVSTPATYTSVLVATVTTSGAVSSTADGAPGCRNHDTVSNVKTRLYYDNLRCVVQTPGSYAGTPSGAKTAGTIYAPSGVAFGYFAIGSPTATYSVQLGSGGVNASNLQMCPSGTLPFSADIWGRTEVSSNVYQVSNVGYSEPKSVRFPIPESLFKITTTVKCQNPAGALFTITGTETGLPNRMPVPSCRLVDPTWVPAEVIATDNDGKQLATFTFPNYQLDYPNCFGPSGLVCDTRVYVGGVQCDVGVAGCAYWWEHRFDSAYQVKCKFGSYAVHVSNCEPLRKTYQGTQIQTYPLTDPQTYPEPAPDPDPTTNPVPQPQPSTGGSTFPSTGSNPASPSTSPDGSTNPDSQNCFAAAWSWNPVDWVYVPVKCALIWAFVPEPAYLSGKVEGLRQDFDGTTPGAWAAAFGGQTYDLSAGGCGGIPVHWNVEGKSFDFDLLEACSGFMATTAAVVKLGATCLLVVFGGLVCLRGVGAGFGWTPSLGSGNGSAAA